MQCSMLDDFHQPSVVDGIEESTDVRVEYPVHFLVNRAPLSRQASWYTVAFFLSSSRFLSLIDSPSPSAPSDSLRQPTDQLGIQCKVEDKLLPTRDGAKPSPLTALGPAIWRLVIAEWRSSPSVRIRWAKTTPMASSRAVGGRPGLRFLLPSYLAAMRQRY